MVRAAIQAATVGVLALLLCGVSRADNVSYTLVEVFSAPNYGIGDFSWTVTLPGFLPELPDGEIGGPYGGGYGTVDFGHFNAVTNPTNGGGCQITNVFMSGNLDYSLGYLSGDTYLMDAFFSPLCDGRYDSTIIGVEVPHDTYGTWTLTGEYDYDYGTPNYEMAVGTYVTTFSIVDTNLPITTPESPTLGLLAFGLFVLGLLALRRSNVICWQVP